MQQSQKDKDHYDKEVIKINSVEKVNRKWLSTTSKRRNNRKREKEEKLLKATIQDFLQVVPQCCIYVYTVSANMVQRSGRSCDTVATNTVSRSTPRMLHWIYIM